MIVNMRGVDEPIYWAGPGDYTWKIIEAADKVNEKGQPYIYLLLKNAQNEHYAESLYPDQHAKRVYQIALALGVSPDEGNDIDTHDFIGGYIRAKVDYIIYDEGSKRGMKSTRMYLQNIRPSNRRRDKTGSKEFTRVKTNYGIGRKGKQ